MMRGARDIALVGGTIWGILAIQNLARYLIYHADPIWVFGGSEFIALAGFISSATSVLAHPEQRWVRILATISCAIAILYFLGSLVPTSVDGGSLDSPRVEQHSRTK